jgi:hypothetical protein
MSPEEIIVSRSANHSRGAIDQFQPGRLLTIGAGAGGGSGGGGTNPGAVGLVARPAIAEEMEAKRPTRMRTLSDDVFISGVGYANSEALMRQNGGNVEKYFRQSAKSDSHFCGLSDFVKFPSK